MHSANDVTPEEIRELSRLALEGTWERPVFPRSTDGHLFIPLTGALSEILQHAHGRDALFLPNVGEKNETIAIFSDYSGEDHQDPVATYSFLVCALPPSLEDLLGGIREEYGLGVREIAFKHRKYGPLHRALPKYFATWDFVHGFLLTVAVEKSIPTLTGIGGAGGPIVIQRILDENDVGGWKPKTAEKLLRILHIASYLIALLSGDARNVFWMMDDDAVLPNSKQKERAMRLFLSILPRYTSKAFANIYYATPFKEPNGLFKDILAIPDLAAGAFAYYFARLRDKRSENAEAERVLAWASRSSVGLRKHAVHIQRADRSGMSGGSLTMIETSDSPLPATTISCRRHRR